MEISSLTHFKKRSVHRVLAHSYSVYFFFFLVGVCLDLIFGLNFFGNTVLVYFGFLFLILATLLIFWAQHTSRHLNVKTVTKESFLGGPYRYTRSPTHWGLFLLMLGFGMVTNAFFVILLTIIPFVVSKLVFLDEEEKILEEKYGEPYREYKKMVRF